MNGSRDPVYRFIPWVSDVTVYTLKSAYAKDGAAENEALTTGIKLSSLLQSQILRAAIAGEAAS